MIVVDTNVISYLLLPNATYHGLATELFEKDRNWIAPALWRYELLNVLALYQRRSILDMSGCSTLYAKSLELIETKDVHSIDRVFRIVEGGKLSGYDSVFVALADETNLPLITEDKKIGKEFPDIAFSMKDYL